MCCCIPLRRLSYFGTAMHLMLGLLYFYFLGSVVYTMYRMRDKDKYDERLKMGLLYVGYYAAFLPPGIFMFWGVHKKLRCFLVVPSILFFFIQIYGVVLEGIYKFRPHGFPEAMEKYNQEGNILIRLQADYWMDMGVQLTVTLTYVFMLFFYYREIGPDDPAPIQSRYAQAYLQQLQNTEERSPPIQSQGSILGPPVPFRPVSQQHSHPLIASNTNLRGNSTPLPPPINLGALNLTYEQQQQLLKLQQHPLIIQQLQHQQQQQQSHPHQHHHDEHELMHRHQQHHHHQGHHQHHPLQGQSHHVQDQTTPLNLFHPYAQMLDPSKTPKF